VLKFLLDKNIPTKTLKRANEKESVASIGHKRRMRAVVVFVLIATATAWEEQEGKLID
jgi:hypothetical protein